MLYELEESKKGKYLSPQSECYGKMRLRGYEEFIRKKLAIESEKLAIHEEKLSFQDIKLAIDHQAYNVLRWTNKSI